MSSEPLDLIIDELSFFLSRHSGSVWSSIDLKKKKIMMIGRYFPNLVEHNLRLLYITVNRLQAKNEQEVQETETDQQRKAAGKARVSNSL